MHGGRSRSHNSGSIDLKNNQNVCLDKISDDFEFGSPGIKTRSIGQVIEMSSGRSRGHISRSIDLKIGQNICLDDTLDEFEFGSRRVIN